MKLTANVDVTELNDNQLKEIVQECVDEMHSRLRAEKYAKKVDKLIDVAKSSKPGGRTWTAAEEEIMKQIYGKVTIRELCSQLNRTEKSVRYKLKKMGLRKNVKINSPRPDKIRIKRKIVKGNHASWKDMWINPKDKKEEDRIIS